MFLTCVVIRNKKFCLLLVTLRILWFSSLKLLRSMRLCFGKEKVTEQRERNMKQFMCEGQVLSMHLSRDVKCVLILFVYPLPTRVTCMRVFKNKKCFCTSNLYISLE